MIYLHKKEYYNNEYRMAHPALQPVQHQVPHLPPKDLRTLMDADAICRWADGTMCFWSEIDQYDWMSDDYHIVQPGDACYDALMEEMQ
mgnify:CR=1 FL=1